jgi:DNA primase large subunit
MASFTLSRKSLFFFATVTALISAVAHSRVSAQTGTGVRVTGDTAPDRIVYEVFFQSVVAWDQRASAAEVPEAQRQKVRNRMREVSGLDVSDYSLVKSVAYSLVSSLQQNALRAEVILRDTKLSAEDRRNALDLLKVERDAAIDAGIIRLRQFFGFTRFAELDQRIRAHIVPRLRIHSGSSAPRGPRQE